jgi:hypothetical protein
MIAEGNIHCKIGHTVESLEDVVVFSAARVLIAIDRRLSRLNWAGFIRCCFIYGLLESIFVTLFRMRSMSYAILGRIDGVAKLNVHAFPSTWQLDCGISTMV